MYINITKTPEFKKYFNEVFDILGYIGNVSTTNGYILSYLADCFRHNIPVNIAAQDLYNFEAHDINDEESTAEYIGNYDEYNLDPANRNQIYTDFDIQEDKAEQEFNDLHWKDTNDGYEEYTPKLKEAIKCLNKYGYSIIQEDFSMGVGAPIGLDQGIPHGGDCKGCMPCHMGLYQRSPFSINPFYKGVSDAHHPSYWLSQIIKRRKKKNKRKFK